jgi:hypothetical protein
MDLNLPVLRVNFLIHITAGVWPELRVKNSVNPCTPGILPHRSTLGIVLAVPSAQIAGRGGPFLFRPFFPVARQSICNVLSLINHNSSRPQIQSYGTCHHDVASFVVGTFSTPLERDSIVFPEDCGHSEPSHVLQFLQLPQSSQD